MAEHPKGACAETDYRRSLYTLNKADYIGAILFSRNAPDDVYLEWLVLDTAPFIKEQFLALGIDIGEKMTEMQRRRIYKFRWTPQGDSMEAQIFCRFAKGKSRYRHSSCHTE